MFFRSISFVALLAASVSTSAVAKDGPPVLAPSSQWHLDYAEGYCRLARRFGGAGKETVFYLEQYEPSDTYTVLVAGPDFKSERLGKPALRFGPEGGTRGPEGLNIGKMEGFGSGLLANSMPMLPDPDEANKPQPGKGAWRPDQEEGKVLLPLDPMMAKSIEWFEMLNGDQVIGRLQLGPMSGPVRALNTCTDELITHWGIDLEKHRTRTKAPTPANYPGDWIGAGDYPTELLRSGTEGIVYFRLDVDETGKPTKCEVQQSTRPAEFDRLVCSKISRNARFSPALDAAGLPMKSFWRSTVRFELPR